MKVFLSCVLLPFFVSCSVTDSPGIVDCDLIDEDKHTWFEVEGNTLIMNGVIYEETPAQLEEIFKDYPGINRIEMQCVFGSDDDDANIVASEMVFERKLHIHLAEGGEIASGGTDFFPCWS